MILARVSMPRPRVPAVAAACLPIVVSLAAAALVSACGKTPVIRHGPSPQRIVTRTWTVPRARLRPALLEAFTSPRPSVPAPFDRMTIRALVPPAYTPDWLATLVDPGEYPGRLQTAHSGPQER